MLASTYGWTFKNDFYEIFALICYQFFQMPFQYLSTELYEIIVSPTAGGLIWQLETGVLALMK